MVVDTSAPLRDIAADFKGKSADEMLEDLGQVPFFMNEFREGDEENMQIEALRALAYEGEPWEVAENFKNQGNECFRAHKFKDAIQFYTQALDQQTEKQEINVACLGNRAQCNLELKNYRKAITDCSRVLDIDAENLKAWYRSAKAFLALGKIPESLVCIERGLAHDASNEGLLIVQKQALERQAKLEELERTRREKLEAAESRKRTLKFAMDTRGIKGKFTLTNNERTNAGDVACQLENPSDPSSTLYLPVLALYPANMESDILQQVDELTTLEDIVAQLFEDPPAWANPQEYSQDNLDVYAQTESGGLAKVGKKSTLAKVFGSPTVIMVDNMARLYIVPRNRSTEWLKNWNKQAQASLLQD